MDCYFVAKDEHLRPFVNNAYSIFFRPDVINLMNLSSLPIGFGSWHNFCSKFAKSSSEKLICLKTSFNGHEGKNEQDLDNG